MQSFRNNKKEENFSEISVVIYLMNIQHLVSKIKRWLKKNGALWVAPVQDSTPGFISSGGVLLITSMSSGGVLLIRSERVCYCLMLHNPMVLRFCHTVKVA